MEGVNAMRIKHILLAEDNPNDVELTLAALAEQGLANHIVVVHDGAEAMEYLLCQGAYADRISGDPSVILLDLKMPRMDGLDVLRAMENVPQLKLIPVVILTSSREEADLVNSYQHGANAYVVKPIQFGEFMKAVRALGMFWALLNEPPPNGGMSGK